MRKTELLSPAGSFEAARAAVNAGADAIYMGGPLFSARAYAESSGKDVLSDTIDFCHLRAVRVFMTLNTLIKEQEYKGLYDYLLPYAKKGLDGVIVQDIGVMRLIKREFPALELHISTQAAVTGPRYAALLQKMGAARIVLARELSLPEIRRIYEKTGAEIEVFAHGALCYSCSGLCLMSSFIGGRSGNRGRCAGTCRLPYEIYDANAKRLGRNGEKYVLSMRDLNTVSRLGEMIAAGVYSFKIEGRMKSPLYVAAVTGVYRKYLDMAMAYSCAEERDGQEGAGKYNCRKQRESRMEECHDAHKKTNGYTVSGADMALLSEVFERGGHTDGYLDHKNGREMLTLTEKPDMRVHDDRIIRSLKEKYIDRDIKLPVVARAVIHTGRVPELTLSCNYRDIFEEVTVFGDAEVMQADKRPMTEADIREKLGKFGGTDFELEDMYIDMGDSSADDDANAKKGCFIPVKALNELRRAAVEALRLNILESFRYR